MIPNVRNLTFLTEANPIPAAPTDRSERPGAQRILKVFISRSIKGLEAAKLSLLVRNLLITLEDNLARRTKRVVTAASPNLLKMRLVDLVSENP